MSSREIATISIYPAQGQSHSSARHLSALAAYTRSLLHALPEEERTRHIVLTNLKKDVATTFEDNGIEVSEVWQKGSPRFVWQIIQAVRATPSLKLIHLQHEFNQFGSIFTLPMIPLLLWILRFILKKKVVITYHEVAGRELLNPELAGNFLLPVPQGIARILFKWYYRITSFAANELFVQHTKFSDILRHEMNVRNSIQILPIGTEDQVNLSDRAVSRQKFAILPDERVLLFFGTLDWRKGLNILIDAFERLPASVYRLIIGGGQPVRIKHRPEYQEWYAGISARISQNKNITQMGFVSDEDIPALFAACDLVVLPYVVPQMVSAVLNHAASYERPVIGSEAFKGHADPLILFKADTESLTEKIRWSFEGHEQELLDYARRYKIENSWTRSATTLTGRYAHILTLEQTKAKDT
jgi:glycosyltransferase involved in cell wall biosynthesis